jgi:hypothetical protein
LLRVQSSLHRGAVATRSQHRLDGFLQIVQNDFIFGLPDLPRSP